MSAKTYYVGDVASIRRLDNIDVIGAPPIHNWIDVSLPSTLYPNQPKPALFDVKSDPTDAHKVFVVGQTNPLFQGIAYSADAGVNWVVPTLSVTLSGILASAPAFKWYEVWPSSTDNVTICGQRGVVAFSTDGGLNFDIVGAVATVSGLPVDLFSLHFLEDGIGNALFGVVGATNYILKTINGGSNWSVLNGGLALPTDEILGIYLSEDQQVIVAVGRSAIVRSSNGGSTFTTVYTFPQREGRHLTWDASVSPITTLWATGTNGIILKSTDQGLTWVPQLAPVPGDYLAAHFISSVKGFYGVTKNNPVNSVYYLDNVGAFLSEDAPITLKTIYAVWTTVISPTCYRVTNCTTGSYYIVNSDLSSYVGKVIRFSIEQGATDPPTYTSIPGCWTVQFDNTCVGSISIQVDAVYDDCSECIDSCYILINCTNPNDYIVTSRDLSAYLHKVVKLGAECNNQCYYISKTNLCDQAILIAPLDPDNIYNDCVTCTNTNNSESTSLTLNPRRIKPGFYTPGCPPEYTIRTNCKFAEQVYDEMAILRYGITICCDHDIDKWDIKKQLLDLRAIYDPSLCTNTIPPCPEPCNVTVDFTTLESTIVVDPTPPVIPCDKPGPSDPIVSFGIPLRTSDIVS